MTDAICSVDDCKRATHCRGLCRAHYDRVRKAGDVQAHRPLRTLPTREERDDIASRILSRCVANAESGCIEWMGYTLRDSGYGSISWGSRQWVVHRAMWTVKRGPIPDDDDWTIDHLCFNRRCVNVDHLEIVTRIENSRRGGGLLRAQSLNKARSASVCKNGHPRTSDQRDANGHRVCTECRRVAWARRSDTVNAQRRAAYARRSGV